MEKKGFLLKNEYERFSFKKRILIAFVILIIGLIGFGVYFIFFTADACDDFECYENALLNCKRVWFVKEDEDYVWRYEILSRADKNTCNVKVRLIKIKNAEVIKEGLEGKEMKCKVEKIGDIYPEKDMSRCNGLLKEELQEIIIDKLHSYLLDNIGKINEELKGV